jgi:hypothetical protein
MKVVLKQLLKVLLCNLGRVCQPKAEDNYACESIFRLRAIKVDTKGHTYFERFLEIEHPSHFLRDL